MLAYNTYQAGYYAKEAMDCFDKAKELEKQTKEKFCWTDSDEEFITWQKTVRPSQGCWELLSQSLQYGLKAGISGGLIKGFPKLLQYSRMLTQ